MTAVPMGSSDRGVSHQNVPKWLRAYSEGQRSGTVATFAQSVSPPLGLPSEGLSWIAIRFWASSFTPISCGSTYGNEFGK